ncbi:MAG: cupin domain-containing protein [Aliifodinibius sp.]|nr:cupin domain-containing protein [Fodinibius sp.]NIV11643.1 cupin domain-containing protein [Fodinibius sp.]NIY25259.1 cupin domain-containing protein [Fodinibius sp.]
MERSISRKGFLTSAALLGIGSMFPSMPAVNHITGSHANPDLVLNADEGEVYLIGDRQGRVTVKVDKRNKDIESMSLLTEDIKPGDAIPIHKHSSEEELIFIEKGSGILTFGDKQYDVTRGSMALVPRTVWHGLKNESNNMLRMVFGYSPSGFEDYFRAIGVPPGEPSKKLTGEDWQQINDKFGVEYRD